MVGVFFPSSGYRSAWAVLCSIMWLNSSFFCFVSVLVPLTVLLAAGMPLFCLFFVCIIVSLCCYDSVFSCRVQLSVVNCRLDCELINLIVMGVICFSGSVHRVCKGCSCEWAYIMTWLIVLSYDAYFNDPLPFFPQSQASQTAAAPVWWWQGTMWAPSPVRGWCCSAWAVAWCGPKTEWRTGRGWFTGTCTGPTQTMPWRGCWTCSLLENRGSTTPITQAGSP